MKIINGSKTSSFGAPAKINHDHALFYAGRLYEGLNNEKMSIILRIRYFRKI